MISKKLFAEILPRNCIKTDYLHRFAWGTDASFYRKVPQMVLFPNSEAQVAKILNVCNKKGIAVTFRAAGTSLSGQSLSDSVLLVAAHGWEQYRIHGNGESISLQPGIVGGRVNEILKPLGRKFSPDPASVSSAMVGGIVANNASGMNCGTHANSHRIIRSVRVVLADGTVLDTGNKKSRDTFCRTHPEFLMGLLRIRDHVLSQPKLTEHIKYKYSIKNVTGLNLLPLVEFEDPFDIMAHLMAGSEGTLAFLSEVTVNTEPIQTHRASSMVYFAHAEEACRAVQALRKLPVIGVELLDRKSLRSVENKEGIPHFVKNLPPQATALLIETAAEDSISLIKNTATIKAGLGHFDTLQPIVFTDKESEYSVLWDIRSGIFPSVGATRPLGTTSMIEDVAFHPEDLHKAVPELQRIIEEHGYHDGAIYGHALEGNFHFILNQAFDTQKEVERYKRFMDRVAELVVDKYNGSLKAEHGTGINMAPFVEREWGPEAFEVMKQLKLLFDYKTILNPGVIFNEDPLCHIKNFKPMPTVHPLVDKCIECGFCEINCLTWGKTLSSRQRIAVQREITRLKESKKESTLLKKLTKSYFYPGRATCAVDGLCATSCPMEINTGDLTLYLREQAHPKGSVDELAGWLAADHFQGLKNIMRIVLRMAGTAHAVLGSFIMVRLTRLAHRMGFPLWTPAMPTAHRLKPVLEQARPAGHPHTVVYFPSCINQSMGVARGVTDNTPLTEKMVGLLRKAGYRVIFPDNVDSLCCGTIWESKGMPHLADQKTEELSGALWIASRGGKYPVLCDQSPCLFRMREKISNLQLYEPVEFIEKFLVPRLDFHPTDQPVALHVTCTSRKMHLDQDMLRLAQRCSTRVIVPYEVGCCGFAGDKGFTRPEINAYALRKLKPQLEAAGVQKGYSNSRTCEIGLTTHGGVPYMSLVYLVDSCTTPKQSQIKSTDSLDLFLS